MNVYSHFAGKNRQNRLLHEFLIIKKTAKFGLVHKWLNCKLVIWSLSVCYKFKVLLCLSGREMAPTRQGPF